jgi:hypothetical protein
LKISSVLKTQRLQLRSLKLQPLTFPISAHTLGRAVDDRPSRACELAELQPFHQQPALDPNFIEVKQQLVPLGCFQRLLVRGPRLPLRGAVLSVPFSFIGANPTPEHGHQHVVDGRRVPVPNFDLDGTRDGVGCRELFTEGFLERLEVVGDGEAVDMFLPMGFVALVLVLVEAQVRGTDEPRDLGTTKSVPPTTDVAGVLVGREISLGDLAVGRDYG